MTILTPQQFEETDGTRDWRALNAGADAWFDTRSHLEGAVFVRRVADLAEAAGHHPDIDLRAAGVHLRLFSHDVGQLTDRDVSLAREISAAAVDGGKDQHEAAGFVDLARAVQSAARGLGLVADPSGVRDFQVGIDALDVEAVTAFWRAALGYVDDPRPGLHDLYDPRRLNPPVFFQQMDEPREQRNRIHLDLFVAADQAQERVTAAVAAGGRVVHDADAPAWWTLADPEGNELDIAVTVGRAERASLD